MAENRESGIFQYTDKTNLSDVEEIREEKKVQEQLLEVMHMLQQYHGIMADHEKGYVLRESVLECFYGTEYVKFDCKKDHGILKGKYPVMTTKGYLEENIHNFGSCLCPEKYYKDRLPMTRAIKEDGSRAQKANYNEFRHICVPLIGQGQEWKQVRPEVKVVEEGEKKKIKTVKRAAKVLEGIDTNVYSELLLENAVLVCQYGGLIMIKEVPDVERDEPEEGNLLTYLSLDYINWLIKAEGGNYQPYRDTADKGEEQDKMNVTITPGITFNMTEKKNWELLHRHLGWEDDEIKNIINTLYGSDEEAKKQIQMRYQITPEQARGMFIELSQDYIKSVNSAIKNYRIDGECYHYTQQQLEAMFDVAYNQGLDPDHDVNNPDKIIHYYIDLEKSKEDAVIAVENNWGYVDPRRRINQMYLFYFGRYDFREDYGYYKNRFKFKK